MFWKAAWVALALVISAGSLLAGPPKKPPKKKLIKQFVRQYLECSARNDSSCMQDMMEHLSAQKVAACHQLEVEIKSVEEAAQPRVAGAMAQLKCPQSAQVFREMMLNVDSDVRGLLALEFASTKDKALLEPIIELVRSGRPFDKEKGCEALAVLGYKEAVPALVKAAADSFFSVRMQAAAALGRFKSDEARDALCALVTKDVNPGVRVKAAESLGQLKDLASVPCLIEALESKTGVVLSAAHAALTSVTGIDLGMDPVAWRQWWEKNKPVKRR